MGFLSRVLLGAAVVAAGLFLSGTTEKDGYHYQPLPRTEGQPGSRYTRHSTQRAEGSSHSAPEYKRRADDQIPPTQPIGTDTTEKHDHHQSRLPFEKCSCSLCVRHSTQRAEGSPYSAPEYKRLADGRILPTQPIGRTDTTEKHDHHQSRLPFEKCFCSLCVRHSTQRAEGSPHSALEYKRLADNQIPPTQPIGRTDTTEKHDHHQLRLPFEKCSCSLCVRHSTQRTQGSSHAVPVYKRRTDDQIPTTQPTRPTHTTEKGDFHQEPPSSDEWPCPHCARNSTQRAEQSSTSAPEHKRHADDPPPTQPIRRKYILRRTSSVLRRNAAAQDSVALPKPPLSPPSTVDVIPRVEFSYLTSDEDSGDEPESGDALRHRARLEGDRMSEYFTQSQDAYKRGDHVDAKRLSEKANAHKREMERLNAMASARIFKENNMSLNPGRVDLHGLYVQEAISYAHEAIENARRQYYSDLRLIVGKGLHCVGDAKIKPAVTEAMTERGLDVEVDPNNAGVLIVRLESVWSLQE